MDTFKGPLTPGSVVLGCAGAQMDHSHLHRRIDIQHAATINTFVYIWLEERDNGAQALLFCFLVFRTVRRRKRPDLLTECRGGSPSSYIPVPGVPVPSGLSALMHSTFDLCGHSHHLFKIV